MSNVEKIIRMNNIKEYLYVISGDGRLIAVQDVLDYFHDWDVTQESFDVVTCRFDYDMNKKTVRYITATLYEEEGVIYDDSKWPSIVSESLDLCDKIEITISSLEKRIESINELLSLLELEENKEYEDYTEGYVHLKQSIVNALTFFEYYTKNSPLNYSYMSYISEMIEELLTDKDFVDYLNTSTYRTRPIHTIEQPRELYEQHNGTDKKNKAEREIEAVHNYLQIVNDEGYKPNYFNPQEYVNHFIIENLNNEYNTVYIVYNDLQMLYSILDFCCMHKVPLRRCRACGKHFIANSDNRKYCSEECKKVGVRSRKNESDLRRQFRRDAVKRTTNSFRSKLDTFPIECLNIPEDAPGLFFKNFEDAVKTKSTEAFSKARAELFDYMERKANANKETSQDLDNWFKNFGRLK